ncbi:ribosomal protein S18-alanine N-acetyltransferase [Geomicrobium sp. JCM 19038]|uniref:ribosomal protein S18-alanine N-acetyltransferase n=1 Tax=Geomicrobium sp. JCM 19038 TaxID=1460635 RepID=UPI00045F2BF0|nr:ribosomal protein S18-alanine N-acetyltransferase [Geomicrobium sp. JCM 19038]GAK10084.1 ribosomal-protein-S18p-alanine acetyltransferase [Geomicrobium sp. JCM 19038]
MTNPQSLPRTVRKMQLDDIVKVLIVERDAFTMPWSEQAFLNELGKNPFANYQVIETHGQIVGYGGMWIVMYEAHITNFAIHSSFRGHSFGKELFQAMLDEAVKYGVKKVTLEVRVSNHRAQKLYQHFGFVKTGLEVGYYTDTNEDAYVMTLEM